MKNLCSLFQNQGLLCVRYSPTIILMKTLNYCQFKAAASPEGHLLSAAGEAIMATRGNPAQAGSLGVKYLLYAKR